MRSLIVLFLLAGVTAHAQTALSIPDGGKLLLHAYAKGVQVYVCAQDPKDTSRYIWTLTEPIATLYDKDNYRIQIGKHYLSSTGQATWQTTTGVTISAVKVQQAPPRDTASIPWLLLKTTSSSGFEPLRATTYVQRIQTHGGKPSPAAANRAHKGQYLKVPYTAEYLFYGPK